VSNDDFEFYDQSALLYRLSEALRSRPQEVVFLLGSPLSAPASIGQPGVPLVSDVIELIRSEFCGDEDQLFQLQHDLSVSENRYNQHFGF
jgi:hypothetical protein